MTPARPGQHDCSWRTQARVMRETCDEIADLLGVDKGVASGDALIGAVRKLVTGEVAAQERVRYLTDAATRSNDEICQTLGKALGYPWFAHDQKNFPGATEADGVCIGEHVAESIAAEAAAKIRELTRSLRRPTREDAAALAREHAFYDACEAMCALCAQHTPIIRGGDRIEHEVSRYDGSVLFADCAAVPIWRVIYTEGTQAPAPPSARSTEGA